MITTIDLNSDMGEGFGPWRIGDGVDDQIMPLISSANIATGFHAGDPSTMSRTIHLAQQHRVRIGSHPGYRDLVGFGRRTIQASQQELINDIVYQMGALEAFARLNGLNVQHVKPHGALYMTMAQNEALSQAFIEAVQAINPSLLVFCMEASQTYKVAKALGQPVVREFFADREYDMTGSIVFTRQVGPLDPAQVARRVLTACQEGYVKTVDGQHLEIGFDSICIHSDTPGALELVRHTRQALLEHGITIEAVGERS